MHGSQMSELNALYIDFNSYFASVEQLLRPELRGRPVAVLPVVAETTCCIAASYEAKAFGVRTGTRVSDARKMCPGIILVEARPALYIEYHHKLIKVVESCTHVEKTLSIDEMVCKLTGSQRQRNNALALATRIKQTIARNVGEEIRCSIGIAPNTYLSKIASNMQKPDGCVVIEQHELPQRLYGLKLRDLKGIGRKMEQRLIAQGIDSVQSLLALNRDQLRSVWGSIDGERFHDKLRGIEPPERRQDRSSLGHSHVLPPELRTHHAALSVLHRLLQKACLRLRSYGLLASAIQVRVKFLNRPVWVVDSQCAPTDNTLQLTQALELLWQQYPARKSIPYAVGVVLDGLVEPTGSIAALFQEERSVTQGRLNCVLDKLNMRYGKNTVYFGGAHNAVSYAPMRIAFNHIPDIKTEGDLPAD
jgi:DNA polymerase-4